MLNQIILVFIGFASGVAVSTAIIAFIVSVGVITKMAVTTGTEKHVKTYNNIILLGVIAGDVCTLFSFSIGISAILLAVVGLFSGIFIGVIAISLVEIMNVLPIMKERLGLNKGIRYIVYSIAAGKLVGSLVYWIQGGFGK